MSTPQKYVDKARELLAATLDAYEITWGASEGNAWLVVEEDKVLARFADALHETAKEAVRGCFALRSSSDGNEQEWWFGSSKIDLFLYTQAWDLIERCWPTESEAIVAREKLVEELTR